MHVYSSRACSQWTVRLFIIQACHSHLHNYFTLFTWKRRLCVLWIICRKVSGRCFKCGSWRFAFKPSCLSAFSALPPSYMNTTVTCMRASSFATLVVEDSSFSGLRHVPSLRNLASTKLLISLVMTSSKQSNSSRLFLPGSPEWVNARPLSSI